MFQPDVLQNKLFPHKEFGAQFVSPPSAKSESQGQTELSDIRKRRDRRAPKLHFSRGQRPLRIVTAVPCSLLVLTSSVQTWARWGNNPIQTLMCSGEQDHGHRQGLSNHSGLDVSSAVFVPLVDKLNHPNSMIPCPVPMAHSPYPH